MTFDVKDKIEIQELSSKYAMAMDDNDVEAWLDTWDDNGVWEGGAGTYKGRQSLRQLFSDLGERIRGKRHAMTNFVITGDANVAWQRCYLLIVDAAKKGPPGTAVYTDVLKRVDGHWRFVHRTVVLDQVAAATVT